MRLKLLLLVHHELGSDEGDHRQDEEGADGEPKELQHSIGLRPPIPRLEIGEDSCR